MLLDLYISIDIRAVIKNSCTVCCGIFRSVRQFIIWLGYRTGVCANGVRANDLSSDLAALRQLLGASYHTNGHFRLTPLRHANKSGVCEVPHSIQNQPAGVIVPVCCSGACVGVLEQAGGEVGGWEAPLVDKMSTTLLW